jgi:hypothetical protein
MAAFSASRLVCEAIARLRHLIDGVRLVAVAGSVRGVDGLLRHFDNLFAAPLVLD